MQSGVVLGDKYRLEELLGRGGMGSVWRAEHLGFRAPVAVKLMDRAVGLDPDALVRFHREAHAAARIRSPHVVQILDHGVDEPTNTPFIVMELLEGETLAERLARDGPLALEHAASVIDDVCRALVRAHAAGIVHRDLKPGNIFLVKDEREFAKVLDFGVAKAHPYELGASNTTRTGSLIGTPYYMSPEQISGSKQLDSRSDLWSVAVMACESVTGRRPFDERTVGALAVAICSGPIPRASTLGTVSPAFEDWLERALQRDPAERFQTARELSDALRAACGSHEKAQVLSSATPDVHLAATEPGVAAQELSTTLGAQTSALGASRRMTARRIASTAALTGALGAGVWLVTPTESARAPEHSGPTEAPANDELSSVADTVETRALSIEIPPAPSPLSASKPAPPNSAGTPAQIREASPPVTTARNRSSGPPAMRSTTAAQARPVPPASTSDKRMYPRVRPKRAIHSLDGEQKPAQPTPLQEH